MPIDRDAVLRDAIEHNAEIVRAFDLKAQIYILAYLAFFQVIVNLRQLEGSIVPIWFLAAFAIALFAAVFLFMLVLAPLRAVKLLGEGRADQDSFFFLSKPQSKTVDDYRALFHASDVEETLLIECYKIQRIRQIKERRFRRADFWARTVVVLGLLLMVFPSLWNFVAAFVMTIWDLARTIAPSAVR
jgi:hypothetical protein